MLYSGRSLNASVQVSASTSKLWACWTEPERLNAWYTVTSSGEPKSGTYYQWKFDDFFGPAQVIRVQEVKPEKSILFSMGKMLVGVRLRPVDGGTQVDVIHEGFDPEGADDAMYEGCRSGWQMALGQLKFYLETYDGQPRQEVLVLEPCRAEVSEWYRDSKARRQWLIVNDPPQEILVDSGSELLMRWDAVGGTLELKQFSWGNERYACLRCSSWSREYDLSYQKADLAESLHNLLSLAR